MTQSQTDKARALQRLRQVPDASLSKRHEQVKQSLIDKLASPVRIGIFGFPGAGKRALVNALVGVPIAARDLCLPTFELMYGAQPRTDAVLPDGGSVTASGYPTREVMTLGPVFLEIRSPTSALETSNILLVAADASPTDQGAALAWAAARVDVSIWCTQTWTVLEQEIWSTAPPTLRNHALLLHRAEHLSNPKDAQALFETTVSVPCGESDWPDAVADTIREALEQTIEEATTQDVLAAEVFLQRYAPRDEGAATTEVIDFPTAVTASQEAKHALARVFQSMRQASDRLLLSLPTDALSSEDVLAVQTDLEAIFENLADRVCGDDVLELTWPQLCTDIADARDLALLLKLEGGLEQMEDAAALLLQLRRDIEVNLAA